jgi:formyl-CoA transferase
MVTELGWYRGLGTPIKMSRTPGGTRVVSPRFNEHGAAILAQHGFTPEQIAELAATGIVVDKRRS